MDYVIRNNRGVYIKIDAGGRPVSCNFKDRTLMDRNKARNILNSLPKSLKKMKFFMEAIPEIPPRVIETHRRINHLRILLVGWNNLEPAEIFSTRL